MGFGMGVGGCGGSDAGTRDGREGFDTGFGAGLGAGLGAAFGPGLEAGLGAGIPARMLGFLYQGTRPLGPDKKFIFCHSIAFQSLATCTARCRAFETLVNVQ